MNKGYRIEVRTNFHGTQAEAEAEAQWIAHHCGGEVTAIWDTDTWDEI